MAYLKGGQFLTVGTKVLCKAPAATEPPPDNPTDPPVVPLVGVYNFATTGPVTFAVALPNSYAATELKLGSIDTQTNVLRTYTGGNGRHVLVSAIIPSTGNINLNVDAAAAGPAVAPVVPDVVLTYTTTAGTPYTCSPSGAGVTRVSGPVMTEVRYTTSFSGAPNPAANLVVYFDVRTYSNGTQRIDVIVHNGKRVSSSAVGHVMGSFSVAVNGVTRETFNGAWAAGPGTIEYDSSDNYTFSSAHGLSAGQWVRLTSGTYSGRFRQVGYISSTTRAKMTSRFNTSSPYAVGNATWEYCDVVQPFATIWRRSYWTTGEEVQITPDMGSFYLAGAFMRPASASISLPSRTAQLAAYDARIMWRGEHGFNSAGNIHVAMTGTGANDLEDIGIVPRHVNQYLAAVDTDQPDTWTYRRYLLRWHEAGGIWMQYLRESDDSIYQITTNNSTSDSLYSSANTNSGQMAGHGREAGAAHQPAIGFAAYLLTGDRFYLDLMKSWALSGITSWTSGRSGASGLVTQQQHRGTAWALRDLGDAVAWMPDSDTNRSYFQTFWDNNMADLALKYAAELHPLSMLEMRYDRSHFSTFQAAYFAQTFQHLVELGYTETVLTQYRDKAFTFYENGWADTDFRNMLASYTLMRRTKDTVGFPAARTGQPFNWNFHQYESDTPFSTYAALKTGNLEASGNWEGDSPVTWGSAYGLHVYVIFACMARAGRSGAAAIANEILAINDNGTVAADLATRSAFYVSPTP